MINYLMVFLEFGGFNVLIDLIFFDCCSFVFFVGFKCCWVLGVVFEDLLCIDFVFLSYDYYDYCDWDLFMVFECVYELVIVMGIGNV